ncbi:MAG: pilus assembly protein PilP [Nitrospirae bacterium]|nr:pilus assembly protein PilP [Nitrospirota bacterium]
MRVSRLISILLLCLTVVVFSCKGKQQQSYESKAQVKTARKVKQKKTIQVKKKPKPYKFEVVKYDPAGRRDPFLSVIALTKQKIEKQKKRKTNPLENYDVTDFKLLGIVYDGQRYYASVLLPDGKAFTVTKGMTVGLYNGKIIDISEGQLVVREYVMNYRGELKPKDTILKLRKEEE